MEFDVDKRLWEASTHRLASRQRSIEKQMALSNLIDELLERDVIRPPKATALSQVHLMRKPSGGWRFTIDYPALNKMITKRRLADTKHEGNAAAHWIAKAQGFRGRGSEARFLPDASGRCWSTTIHARGPKTDQRPIPWRHLYTYGRSEEKRNQKQHTGNQFLPIRGDLISVARNPRPATETPSDEDRLKLPQ